MLYKFKKAIEFFVRTVILMICQACAWDINKIAYYDNKQEDLEKEIKSVFK